MKQVTGSNPTAASDEMSIQLRSGGHSFPKELPGGCLTARKVHCSVLTHKTVLVPVEFFDRESAGNYLDLAGLGCSETEKAVYSDPQQQQIAVMAVDEECRRYLTETLGDRAVFTSPLLYEPKLVGPGIWLIHTDGLLYVKLFDKRLRLAEVVRAQGTADILYYLGQLNREVPLTSYPLCLSGSSTLARQLKTYFRDVRCE